MAKVTSFHPLLTGPIPFMPIDMLDGEAVLSLVEPLPASLLIFILLGCTMSFLVNMYAIM
jgi:hypothetical protein